ncbi:hypothetical protein TKK_0016025 [Trichogramma kaykai]
MERHFQDGSEYKSTENSPHVETKTRINRRKSVLALATGVIALARHSVRAITIGGSDNLALKKESAQVHTNDDLQTYLKSIGDHMVL